ncbi:MAG: hypothetical protein JWR10_3635 [Rubritepida sp.]|nr:hypothetical protein [Rubritepida sp.]
MLFDRVRCAVPNPGAVGVGSAITLGASPSGYRSFLAAAGATKPAYFVLADGAGRAITGVWTVNAGGTATITEILGNDRLGGTAGETFAGACTAWNTLPAVEEPLVRSGPLAGFRNLLINGNPTINQRGYTSGGAVASANFYTLDRWRVVTSGQAASWVDSAGIRSVTAPAGGMEQVVEGASILAGVHTLSWQGTAVALVNGAAVANGAQVTLAGNTDAVLRFSSGTFSLAQLEPGPMATRFERRPIGAEQDLCERYYEQLWSSWIGNVTSGVIYGAKANFRTRKRTVPTITSILANLIGAGSFGTRGFSDTDLTSTLLLATATATVSGGGYRDFFSADAEL